MAEQTTNDINKQLRNKLQTYEETIDKAIDKLYCWGEVLDADFQKEMLNILKIEREEKIMTEQALLNSGYKYFPNVNERNCDRYYQKKISGFDDEPTSYFAVYYYDKFKFDGALNYSFEYEYVEERENYWYETHIWRLDKDYPYTIEEIEQLLKGGIENEKKNTN